MSDLPDWLRGAAAPFFGALAGGRTHHAWLLQGGAGSGQDSLMAAMSAALLCKTRSANGEACGQCQDCILRSAGHHHDVHRVELIDGKRQIGVDQIRAATEKLQGRPQRGGWQVLEIRAADRMNTAAANALLKTLEEPSPDSALLLSTQDSGRLLPTIKSRCRKLVLGAPSPAQLHSWLQTTGASAPDIDAVLALHDLGPLAKAQFLRSGALKTLRQRISVLSNLVAGSQSLSATITALKPPDATVDALPMISKLWLLPSAPPAFAAWHALGAHRLSAAVALIASAENAQRQLGTGLSADALLLSWCAQLRQTLG